MSFLLPDAADADRYVAYHVLETATVADASGDPQPFETR